MSITDQQNQRDPVVTVGDPFEVPTTGRRARRLAEQGQVAPQPPAPDEQAVTTQSKRGKEPQERKPRRPMSTARGATVWVLTTVSLLTLWFVLYAVVLTPFQESHSQAVLYNTMREQLALQVAPLGNTIAPGVPVALISAPALGIADVVVVEGTASGDLMSGPGHRRDTVLPGQAGISVLYGRASLFGGPFGALSTAHVGDAITVTTGQGVFQYMVEGRRQAGDPFPAAVAAGGGRLTLVSAVGDGRAGALSPTGAVFVDARLTGVGQPSPGGRPAAVPKAEQAMQGDPSALLGVALALPLLIAAILFVAWARTRWGGWQSWLVGMPIVLGALWAVSQAAVQLLPNLL